MGNQGWVFFWLVTLLISLTPISSFAEVESVPGEFVVKLKSKVGMFSAGAMAHEMQGEIKSYISESSKAIVLKKSILVRSDKAIQALNEHPLVVLAEPNYIFKPVLMPNDSQFSKLWGMLNSSKTDGPDIDAELAWDLATGSKEVVVGVIDTGVDYLHEDLKNNMWMNDLEKNGQPGVDDDGNGYVDDIFGYDFANDDGDPMDDGGHGTHCSGTIGAEGDNGVGVTGVNWNVKIMGIKFLGKNGGTLDAAIKAIDYGVEMKADILSNSWGGGGFSQNLKESIERAEEAGILFVAAAGNEASNNDNVNSYPANYDVPNVISVAAIDSNGALAGFSNYGKSKVHIAAPGVDILSTTPGNKYEEFSGTSMATPHVSGVAALLLAHEPGLSYGELKERILNTARPLASLSGKVSTGATLNAYNALTNTVPPPDENDPSLWPLQAEDVSTEHPYKNNTKESFTFTVPGAEKVAVHFARLETENRYDKVIIKDASGKEYGSLTGVHNDSFSPVVDGDTIIIEFESDFSVTRHGLNIDGVAYKGPAEAEWDSRVADVSTPHPYPNFMNDKIIFEEPGASEIKVLFSKFETELNYDKVTFKDGDGNVLDVWDGVHNGEFSPTALGDSLIVEIKSDWSVRKYGFDVESVHYK